MLRHLNLSVAWKKFIKCGSCSIVILFSYNWALSEKEYKRDKGDRPAPKVGITFLNFLHKVSNKYCSRARCSARSDINYRCFYIQSSFLSTPHLFLSSFFSSFNSDNWSLDSLQPYTLNLQQFSSYCSWNSWVGWDAFPINWPIAAFDHAWSKSNTCS